jgi:hypothetical protein
MKNRSLLIGCLTLGACASAPQNPQGPVPDPFPDRYQAGQGTWGDRWVVDALALPAVWLKPDQDNRLSPGQEADEAVGAGYAVRGGVGNRDQSVGIMYMGAFTEEESTDTDLGLHIIFLDFDVTMPIDSGGGHFFAHAGAGVGLAMMEFDGLAFEDTTTGAMNLRLDFEFRPTPKFALLFGLGGLLIGHPGDTEAFGTFVELGGRVTF